MTDFERKLLAVNLDLHKCIRHVHETIKGVLDLLPEGDARNALEVESHLILETLLTAIADVTEGDEIFR